MIGQVVIGTLVFLVGATAVATAWVFSVVVFYAPVGFAVSLLITAVFAATVVRIARRSRQRF